MAELADALDLGSSTARCRGSTPLSRNYELKVASFWGGGSEANISHSLGLWRIGSVTDPLSLAALKGGIGNFCCLFPVCFVDGAELGVLTGYSRFYADISG